MREFDNRRVAGNAIINGSLVNSRVFQQYCGNRKTEKIWARVC